MIDKVESHASHWFICLLQSTLGIHLPAIPAYCVRFSPPLVDFWAGLHDDAWQAFSAAESFGQSWQSIPGFRDTSITKDMVSRRDLRTDQFPRGNDDVSSAKHFANEAVNPSRAKLRRSCSLYVFRFCIFFRRDFFIGRAFESLNAELKLQHIGVRKAFQTLL